MLDNTLLTQCTKRFAREPSLVAAWVFGSAASGRLREDSDVDFALHYQPGAEPKWSALGELAEDLEIDLLHQVASEHWQDLAALYQALGLKIVVKLK